MMKLGPSFSVGPRFIVLNESCTRSQIFHNWRIPNGNRRIGYDTVLR